MSNKYLIPILTLKENGGGAVALSLARALVSAGANVIVISSGFHGVNPLNLSENRGIKFFIIPPVFGNAFFSTVIFLVVASIYSLLSLRRVVYTHIATSIIPNLSSERSLWLAQDIEYRFFSGYARIFSKLVFAWLMRRSSLIVTSIRLGRYFSRFDCDVIYVDDVGISKKFLERSHFPLMREYDFFLIAKGGAHKRYEETCQIAVKLADRGYKVFLIDQSGITKGFLPNLIVNGALPQGKVMELFGRSRVFVSISKSEGYGLTPLEALSQGSQVICTPVPSTANVHSVGLYKVPNGKDIVSAVLVLAETVMDFAKNTSVENLAVYTGPVMERWARRAAQAVLQ